MADQPHVKHKFKKRHFARPTRCFYCQQLIWGVGKNGFRCSDCGYNVHLNECVAKAANRTSCDPENGAQAPFKPTGERIKSMRSMIRRASTSDSHKMGQHMQKRLRSASSTSSTIVVMPKDDGEQPQAPPAYTPPSSSASAAPYSAPAYASMTPAIYQKPIMQKLPSQAYGSQMGSGFVVGASGNAGGVQPSAADIQASIQQQQQYIARLQQQIIAHQNIIQAQVQQAGGGGIATSGTGVRVVYGLPPADEVQDTDLVAEKAAEDASLRAQAEAAEAARRAAEEAKANAAAEAAARQEAEERMSREREALSARIRAEELAQREADKASELLAEKAARDKAALLQQAGASAAAKQLRDEQLAQVETGMQAEKARIEAERREASKRESLLMAEQRRQAEAQRLAKLEAQRKAEEAAQEARKTAAEAARKQREVQAVAQQATVGRTTPTRVRVDTDMPTIKANSGGQLPPDVLQQAVAELSTVGADGSSSGPLPGFEDLSLPGMETIDFSCGGGLQVLQQIARQYESQRRAAEEQLHSLQAQAELMPAPAIVPQPKVEKRDLTARTPEQKLKAAEEMATWLGKEMDSEFPNENRISKLLSALKEAVYPLLQLKDECPQEVKDLVQQTRDYDLRAGDVLTMAIVDDCEWLYDEDSDDSDGFFEETTSDGRTDTLIIDHL